MAATAVTEPAPSPRMSSARQTAEALIEAWNSHDLDRIVALYAPDYEGTDVAWPTPRRGREHVRQGWQDYLAAFPDLRFSPREIVAEGDCVTVSWVASGTHEGVLMNIPPTRRTVSVSGVSVCHVEGGQVKRATHVWDVAGLLRTFGLLPDL